MNFKRCIELNIKHKCDAVVGALYNAFTSKEVIANPSDILNLSLYNSEDSNNYISTSIDDFDFEMNGIKRVSLNVSDDVSLYNKHE